MHSSRTDLRAKHTKPLKEWRRDNRLAVEAIYLLEGLTAAWTAISALGTPVRCPVCRGYGERLVEDIAEPVMVGCTTCDGIGLLYPRWCEEDRFEDHQRPCSNTLHSGTWRTMISCNECRAEVGLAPKPCDMTPRSLSTRKQHPRSAMRGSMHCKPKGYG